MIRTVPRPPATARSRSGAAAVEFCVVLTWVLFPLMVGIWEVGRAVQVQQMVSTAAREGARLAAQGRTTTSSGGQTDIRVAIAPGSNPGLQPNVKAAVMQSLAGSGLSGLKWADVTVTFAFTDKDMTRTDPYQGEKNQNFTVTVSVNFDAKVRWSEGTLGNFGITTIRSTTKWQMLVDDPFTVNTNLPTW